MEEERHLLSNQVDSPLKVYIQMLQSGLSNGLMNTLYLQHT